MRFAALALVVGGLGGCGKTTEPPEGTEYGWYTRVSAACRDSAAHHRPVIAWVRGNGPDDDALLRSIVHRAVRAEIEAEYVGLVVGPDETVGPPFAFEHKHSVVMVLGPGCNHEIERIEGPNGVDPLAYAAHLHAARLHLEDLNRFGWAP